MSHGAYWYLGIAVLSLILLIYLCVKKPAATCLLMFLIMVQLAYLIESVIYIFLEGYEYHPNLLKHSAYYDSNLGAMASNMLIVPALATLLAVFRLRVWWWLLFIGFLAGVEWLFLRLNIYTHHWWRTAYTAIGLVFYFWTAKVVYSHLLRPMGKGLHFVVLFLATAPLLGTFHIIPIMFFLNRYYHPGWFADPEHDTTAFASIYYVSITLLIAALVMLGWRSKGWNMAWIIGLVSVLTWILNKTALLESRTWWDPWYYILFPGVAYLFSETISKRLGFR
ncbi:hypothetical protein [Paenibacillus cremeus]|uniref:Uncharacterized protein n=1 Tax=Paenibacillus cremeus TaxID=2163881 RepID=A0A559JKE2_9BACL|nr:hypothetical protein [Paenibacillus cremeus]TVY00324.1 hypothetical protein FPZ49_33175 [Paenibacillus cremeus]